MVLTVEFSPEDPDQPSTYRGLVKEILSEIRRELKESPHAIATGGDAALIAQGVPEIERVDPDLTLHGLRIIAERVFL